MLQGWAGLHLLHSTIQGDIPVLLVHVVVACTGLIPDPYAVVLNLGGVLLSDLQFACNSATLCQMKWQNSQLGPA